MTNARDTKRTSGRVSAHLPAALVLCASVAAPLATATEGADTATLAGAVRWTGALPVVAFEAPVARPVFVPAERGPSAVVRGADGRTLGWTRDQVVDRASGRVTHVILETAAGRTVAVAATRFAWDPQKKELWLAAGPAELSESPVFDPAELQRLEGPAWNVAGVFQAGRIPSTSSDSSHSVLASDLVQRPVTVDGRVVGAVESLLLDPQRGEVAFVLLAPRSSPVSPPTHEPPVSRDAPVAATSGEPVGPRPTAEAVAAAEAPRRIPVPWSALTLGDAVPPGDGGAGGGCSPALESRRLASAPSVPVDLHPLGNPDFLASVERHWRPTDSLAH